MIRINLGNAREKGLSLIEIIIAISIIAILGTITFVALKPSKYALESRDIERESETLTILNKLYQYLADDNSIDDLETAVGIIGECGVSYSSIGTSGINLAAVLVDDYMQEIPIDPSRDCSETDTCYDICKNSGNMTITVKAPNAETKTIEVSR
ncbi:MAG: prepilin-type N-terminal cleavage/methylation domain-containing protein [Candidatus Dojkabacteria bacterium]|nr:prepilin-type N-terminal cleavage/methylation domain-containing protein [Candidatus Dojkabacteria bacterium]